MAKKHSFAIPLVALSIAVMASQAPGVLAQTYTDSQGRSITKDEYDAGQLVNEAVGLLNQNKNAEATFRLERAVQMAPNVADTHYNYGIALAKMGQTEDALKQYQDATRLNPEMAYAWMNLGTCYQLLGKIEEAVQTYTEFVTRFPSHPEAGKLRSLITGLNKELGRQTNLPPARPAAQQPPPQQSFQQPAQKSGPGTSSQPRPSGNFAPPQSAKTDLGVSNQANQGGGFQSSDSQGLSGWQGAGSPSSSNSGGSVDSSPPQQGLSGWQGTPAEQPGSSGGTNPQRGNFQPIGQAQQADPSRFGPPDEPPVQTYPAPQAVRPPVNMQPMQQPMQQQQMQQPMQRPMQQPPMQQPPMQQPGMQRPAQQPPMQQPLQQPPKKPVQVASSSPPQQSGTRAGAGNTAANYLAEIGGAKLGRWPAAKMPLKVCIVPASNVQGYQPSFDQLLIKCFQDWGNSSGGKISFKGVSDAKTADIVCTWTSDTSKFMNTAEAGETTVYGANNVIQHCTIQILTVPHPMSPGVPVSEPRLRWICLHEIGHALGLGGHTRNPQDIMFFSTPLAEVWKDLTPRDISTIQALYSK